MSKQGTTNDVQNVHENRNCKNNGGAWSFVCSFQLEWFMKNDMLKLQRNWLTKCKSQKYHALHIGYTTYISIVYMPISSWWIRKKKQEQPFHIWKWAHHSSSVFCIFMVFIRSNVQRCINANQYLQNFQHWTVLQTQHADIHKIINKK